MPNIFLNLGFNLYADCDNKDGWKAAQVASLIEGSSYFNGELKLRGKLTWTNLISTSSSHDIYNKQIEALNKIKILDVSEIENTNQTNNFTRFCNNIVQYKGITPEHLLSSQLNINNVSFKNVVLSIDKFLSIPYYKQEYVIKRFLNNGGSIEHFTVTTQNFSELSKFICPRNESINVDGVWQSFTLPPVINKIYYDIDLSEELTISNISSEAVDFGFKYQKCDLHIETRCTFSDYTPERVRWVDEVVDVHGNRCRIKSLPMLLDLGFSCIVDIHDTEQFLRLLPHLSPKVVLNFKEKFLLPITNTSAMIFLKQYEDVSGSGFLKNCEVCTNKISLSDLDFNSNFPSDSLKEVFAMFKILNINIKKPGKNSYKYIQEAYKIWKNDTVQI